MDDKIMLIGFGVLEKRGDDFYTKTQVAKYLTEFANQTDETTFVGHKVTNDNFTGSISPDVDIICSDHNEIDNHMEKFLHLIAHFFRILSKVDRETYVLINCPNTLYTPLFIPLMVKSRGMFVYIASSFQPAIDEKDKSSLGGIVGRILLLLQTHLVSFTEGALTRGTPEIKTPVDTIHSYPIISIPEATSTEATSRERLLYVGGLYPRKNIRTLIEAFLEVKGNLNRDMELLIVGDGNELDALKELVDVRGLGDSVKFKGWIDDPEQLANIYNSSDLFIFPSIGPEGFPRVIDEAQFYGLPVIASDLRSYSSYFSNEFDILLVSDPADRGGLVEQIQRILVNPDLYERVAKNGARRTEQLGRKSAAEQHYEFIFR